MNDANTVCKECTIANRFEDAACFENESGVQSVGACEIGYYPVATTFTTCTADTNKVCDNTPGCRACGISATFTNGALVYSPKCGIYDNDYCEV